MNHKIVGTSLLSLSEHDDISLHFRILKELNELSSVLRSDAELVTRFYKEYEDLNVWLTDTHSMLEVRGPTSTPGLMGVAASPAQLRGKHQVSLSRNVKNRALEHSYLWQ